MKNKTVTYKINQSRLNRSTDDGAFTGFCKKSYGKSIKLWQARIGITKH